MAGGLKKVPSSGGIQDVAQLFATLSPMFGSGKSSTTTNQQASVDPKSLAQSDELLARIMGQSESSNIDAMIQNILARARQEFGPALATSRAAGVRGYSDTVVRQLGSEAMARATAEAAAAKLNFQNSQNRVASDLVTSRMANTRSVRTTQTSRTGASPFGKASALALAGAQIYNKLKKKPEKIPSGSGNPTVGGFGGLVGSDYAAGITSDFDSGFAASQEAQIGLDAFGPLEGGADAAALFSSMAAPESAEFVGDLPIDPALEEPVSASGGAAGDTVTSGAELGTGSLDFLSASPADVGTSLAATGAEVPANFAATQGISNAPNFFSDAGIVLEGVEAAESAEAVASAAELGELGADVGANILFDQASGEAIAAGMEAATEATAEGAFSFALPPGTFTIVNTLTGGELTNALVSADDKLFDGAIVNAIGQGGEFIDDAIHDIADELTDFDDNVIQPIKDFGSDIVEGIGDAIESVTGGCFITTAATRNGETDNGFTLQTLREFRSTYMQEEPERQSELVDYYLLAPIIVRRIDKFDNADDLYQAIREKFLAPAVSNYLAGMPEETYKIYKNMMYWARQQVGLANPGGFNA